MNKPIIILMDDVHLEGREINEHKKFAEDINLQIEEIKKFGNIPIVICAGDIGEGTAGVEWASQFKSDVIYICGNHEFWNQDFYEVPKKIKEFTSKEENKHINFLYNESIVLHGIRFIGSTLWTNIGNYLPWFSKNHILKFYAAMGDFKRTKAVEWYSEKNISRLKEFLSFHGVEDEKINELIENQQFNPLLEKDENQSSTNFLTKELNIPYDGKTVVITHHLPVYELWMKKKKMEKFVITGEFINNERQFFEAAKGNDSKCREVLMMGYYANDLKKLMYGKLAPEYWLHGHLHQEMSEVIGKTKIISSPVGYQKQSNKMKFKIIEMNNGKNWLADYVKKEIDEYDWNITILQNLRDFETMITKFEMSVASSMAISTDFSPMLKIFQEKHSDNIFKLKQQVCEWLKLFVYDKYKELSDQEIDFYITAKLSGLTETKLINSSGMVEARYKIPEFVAAAVNELSFLSEQDYKLRNKNNLQYYHYKDWMKELQKIQIQIHQFKKLLIAYCDQYPING